ncbi:glycosyltransferase family 2 protein [Pseudohalioglobus sediminis]|uniref:Glycosyltransferase family 2 protein n=1 Tax=Pseudohalioglobus sediminis TaxID=2606449 RepID=A0A5B0WVG8_9GAMM|nr:glycosyltransferase family 2 protein [Pseudohalioglobus sediminis]KAA1190487.1 glycosyltransferase family 2 protein [Pseudohalioglobus sediminis]
MYRPAIVIPVYNHPTTVRPLLLQLEAYKLPVILVNDGSDTTCTETLRALDREFSWASLIERENNGGKGAAVKAGLREAAQQGYTHALQVDADGQHELGDLSKLLSLSRGAPEAVISGAPDYRDVPAIRYYGRYLTHFWVWINTLSLDIEDSMCGFRAYPLASTLGVIDTSATGDRMDFDPEILVRLHWAGVQVIQFRTPVHYPQDGISHFKALQDNMLISWAHTRMFFGMCLRLPFILQRKWQHRG